MDIANQSKPATSFTKKAHDKVYNDLNFGDNRDFEDARRGFIAPLETKTLNEQGMVIWDLEKIKFLDQDTAPETVNPSLWRNEKLQAITGLFKVVDGVYQVRGQGLATTTFIEGKTGVIVCDTQASLENAKATMELYFKHRPKKPVTAIIVSHSHPDHYGGTQAVLQYAEGSQIPIVAPQHFAEHALSEQVLLGTIMSRRAQYQGGFMLPFHPKGNVGIGAGFNLGTGKVSFELPTVEIENEILHMDLDGITFTFLLNLNTEAPAVLHFYVRNYKVIFAADNTNKTMMQIYSVRGAKTRDSLAWANALDKTIELFKKEEIEALLMGHAWPVWGKNSVLEHLKSQFDLYKYMHDQTVRLANHGYTMEEIAETIKLTVTLSKYWGNREYYGTLKHNVKGIYNYYLGYYSSHPSDLDPLPQVESGQKYVQYMGGAANVTKQAKTDFENGEYRWVAQVLKHVVMDDPNNTEAKQLLADAYEQMGYQAESAIWRNVYLSGAHELRNGVKNEAFNTTTIAMNMSVDYILKMLDATLNGPKAEDKKVTMNVTLSDKNETFTIYLENCVITHKVNTLDANPDIALTVDKETFFGIVMGRLTPDQASADGKLELSGDPNKLNEFLALLDSFNLSSNIVTP